MGIFDFFKRKKNEVPVEIPSPEQIAFATIAIEIIGTTIEKYGFTKNENVIKTYSTDIVFRKKKQYVRIQSTSYPTDYPYYYNIELGEGDSENFWEFDWNSVGVWALAKVIDPTINIKAYDFPYREKIKPSLEKANQDLVKYCSSFLDGDLSIFYEARKQTNKLREPYKLHTPNKNGVYTTIDEPKSAIQKKKYS